MANFSFKSIFRVGDNVLSLLVCAWLFIFILVIPFTLYLFLTDGNIFIHAQTTEERIKLLVGGLIGPLMTLAFFGGMFLLIILSLRNPGDSRLKLFRRIIVVVVGTVMFLLLRQWFLVEFDN